MEKSALGLSLFKEVKMKIGINDGCANGGMMDSMSISPFTPEDKNWEPTYTVEVTEEQWAEWQAFLLLHDRWESFWDTLMRDATRRSRKR